MKTSIRWFLLIVAVVLNWLPANSSGAELEKTVRPNWRSVQDLWWNDRELVKDAVVSAHKLLHDNLSLQFDPSFNAHLGDIAALLLIFDSDSTEASIRVLATLSSYQLGATENEIYSCLIKRKGPEAGPILQQFMVSPVNDCIDRFGQSASSLDGKAIPICRTDASYREKLKDLIASIAADTKCTLDR